MAGPTYRLRYFFDAGSGTCLWSANDAARAAFDYPVDHHALPLGAATKARLDHLIARFDGSIDLVNADGVDLWDQRTRAEFHRDASTACAALVAELGASGFEILDCSAHPAS